MTAGEQRRGRDEPIVAKTKTRSPIKNHKGEKDKNKKARTPQNSRKNSPLKEKTSTGEEREERKGAHNWEGERPRKNNGTK